MGNVVTLNAGDDPEFVSALQETLDHLDATADQLQDELVGLAMAGPWRAWSDQQAPGTLMRITGKAMSETGDGRINRLCDVLYSIRSALSDLARYREPRKPSI